LKETKKVAEQRKEEVLNQLRELGRGAYEAIDAGRFPEITLPSRSVRNIVYDEKLRQFILGESRVKRSAHNVKHIRPYAQLMWLAYFAQQLVRERKTSTLRDVFYSAQAYNAEFADQDESDETITDLETALMKAREDFNIYPEERSSIFGELTVEYTIPGYEGKRLDLTSHPDGVMIGPALTTAEFVDTNAEMVMAIEKGGLFTRFIEENVHKKHRAILVNTAGQPPRSTRYIIRRLNQELGLPVYIFTDSVAGDEPILVRRDGGIYYTTMQKLADVIFGGRGDGSPEWRVLEGERWEALSFDPKTLKVLWTPISVAYRHKVDGPLYEVKLEDGRRVKVTRNHSLFTLRQGEVTPIATSELKVGQHVMMPIRLPPLESGGVHHEAKGSSKAEKSWAALVQEGVEVSPEPHPAIVDRRTAWALGLNVGRSLRRREGPADKGAHLGPSGMGWAKVRKVGGKPGVPAAVWGMPSELKLEFVKGLMTGLRRGHRYGSATFYGTSGEKLSSQLAYLLRSLGCGVKVSTEGRSKVTLHVSGLTRKASPRLSPESFPELFEISRFGLRKGQKGGIPYARLLRYVEAMASSLREVEATGRTSPGMLSYLSRKGFVERSGLGYSLTTKGVRAFRLLERASSLLRGDLEPVKVTSVVERPGGGTVYDLTVPGGRSFVAGRNCALVHNSDPWGAHIAMVIISGSANAAHLRELTTPAAKWLGVYATDIIKYKLPYEKLNELDIKRLYELQKDPRYEEKLWKEEIECFLKYRRKAEQEAFARYGLTYIVDKYLPEKLETARSL
jgi:DNA topoisomerase-6 subunit A